MITGEDAEAGVLVLEGFRVWDPKPPSPNPLPIGVLGFVRV